MRRRNLIIGAGSAIAGSGAIVGSSAFSTSAAFGTVDVTAQTEDVEVHSTHSSASDGDDPISGSIDISKTANQARVNVDDDLFGLRATNGDGYNIEAVLVDDDGAPITDLSNHLTNVLDFRLLATGAGNNRSNIQYIENTGDVRGGDTYPTGKFRVHGKDDNSNQRTRSYVPGVGDPSSSEPTSGSITLSSSGDTAQIATVVVVKDTTNSISVPDLRLDVTPTSSS